MGEIRRDYNSSVWERQFFRRMPWGWIFRSPIRWWPLGFGPPQYFVLNDAQKTEVWRVMGCRMGLRYVLLSLAGLIPLALAVWNWTPRMDDIVLTWILACFLLWLFAVFWTQVVLNLFFLRSIGPILADAPRSNYECSVAEFVADALPRSSVGTLMTCGLLLALISGLLAYEAFAIASPTIGRWIMIGGSGLLAICNLATAVIRLKTNASNR